MRAGGCGRVSAGRRVRQGRRPGPEGWRVAGSGAAFDPTGRRPGPEGWRVAGSGAGHSTGRRPGPEGWRAGRRSTPATEMARCNPRHPRASLPAGLAVRTTLSEVRTPATEHDDRALGPRQPGNRGARGGPKVGQVESGHLRWLAAVPWGGPGLPTGRIRHPFPELSRGVGPPQHVDKGADSVENPARVWTRLRRVDGGRGARTASLAWTIRVSAKVQAGWRAGPSTIRPMPQPHGTTTPPHAGGGRPPPPGARPARRRPHAPHHDGDDDEVRR